MQIVTLTCVALAREVRAEEVVAQAESGHEAGGVGSVHDDACALELGLLHTRALTVERRVTLADLAQLRALDRDRVCVVYELIALASCNEISPMKDSNEICIWLLSSILCIEISFKMTPSPVRNFCAPI